MVGKTQVKKYRTNITTRKQHKRDTSTFRNADLFNNQRGGDDPVIEGIVEDIKTLNKNIIKAKPYTDGAKFKKDLIDPFEAIVYLFKQNIGNNITKKDLTSLTKSLKALPEAIEQNKPSLIQFYPSFYSKEIPREITEMIETIRTKPESISEPVKPSKKQQEKIKKQLKEEKAKMEAETLQRELERSQRESAETLLMDSEHTHSNKAEETRKSILYAEQRRLKRLQNEKLLDESNRIKEETTQNTQQFNIEISRLFNTFIDIYEEQLEALHDPQTLVSIINTIYPNVVNYSEKIDTQDKNDARLYKLYSFQLFILIGMLSRFLKTKAPELKLIIKGGKAAQMILSPKPTLELKSDDIDVLVQHPDPLYAKIFSQQFATFFEQHIQDTAHISILLANPTNPNVVKISYIIKDNKFVVISDIDSKPLPNPELFKIIETKKSKDIVIDEDGVETTYPFRLTYYHQSRESFFKEKRHWYQKYSGLPPSDINSRFAEKANDYMTMMASKAPPSSPSTPEKYGMFMPPAPPSSPK